jgi:hypothetical protein
MSNIQEFNSQFGAMADEEIAAYEAYRRIYETRTPPPTLAKVQHSDTWVLLGLIVVMAASIVVSGSRTIVEFGGGLVGYAAFVMIEVGIIILAYVSAINNYSKEKHLRIHRRLAFGVYFALTIAVFANIHAVLKAANIELPAVLNTILLLAIAICASVLLFISGEGAVMVIAARARRSQQMSGEYQAALDEWRGGLNQSWNGAKKGILARQADRQKVSVLSERTDRQTDNSGLVLSERTTGQTDRQTGYGYNRTNNGQAKVLEHLAHHPEDASLTSRKLAERTGVGHDTANKARNTYLAQLQNLPISENVNVEVGTAAL